MGWKDPERRREYQRRYQRERVRRRRAEWFATNGPCVDCGSPERLELDHVDASTKVTNSVWHWAPERMLAELAKCVVRCHDCHARKTVAAGEKPCGQRHGGAKLTDENVRSIRRKLAGGERQIDLAAAYGVSKTCIWEIAHDRKWNRVA